MSAELLAKLQAIDPVILADVVRQDQRSPTFQITDWSVRRLSDKGIMNPNGLWLYSGEGADGQGTRAWSVVLKILTRQLEAPPENDLWHWKRELSLAQSGVLERLPGPVKAPRYYQAEEVPEGAWIWMEQVHDRHPGRWTLDQHAFAARELGRWNAACLQQPPQLEAPWLARQQYRSWLAWLDSEQAWQVPLNQHVTAAQRARYDALWAERETFYAVLEALPQVISHYDSQRRNLMMRQGLDGQDELVALDWAQVGIAPLGAELNWFVGGNIILLEWPPAQARELDRVAFANYVDGLQAAGWSGEVEQVRLAFTAYLAVFLGCIFPAFAHLWCAAENRENALQALGSAEEELFWQALPMLEYSLDCADEARRLMHKLGF